MLTHPSLGLVYVGFASYRRTDGSAPRISMLEKSCSLSVLSHVSSMCAWSDASIIEQLLV